MLGKNYNNYLLGPCRLKTKLKLTYKFLFDLCKEL